MMNIYDLLDYLPIVAGSVLAVANLRLALAAQNGGRGLAYVGAIAGIGGAILAGAGILLHPYIPIPGHGLGLDMALYLAGFVTVLASLPLTLLAIWRNGLRCSCRALKLGALLRVLGRVALRVFAAVGWVLGMASTGRRRIRHSEFPSYTYKDMPILDPTGPLSDLDKHDVCPNRHLEREPQSSQGE
jgi:hypothetical protein